MTNWIYNIKVGKQNDLCRNDEISLSQLTQHFKNELTPVLNDVEINYPDYFDELDDLMINLEDFIDGSIADVEDFDWWLSDLYGWADQIVDIKDWWNKDCLLWIDSINVGG